MRRKHRLPMPSQIAAMVSFWILAMPTSLASYGALLERVAEPSRLPYLTGHPNRPRYHCVECAIDQSDQEFLIFGQDGTKNWNASETQTNDAQLEPAQNKSQKDEIT